MLPIFETDPRATEFLEQSRKCLGQIWSCLSRFSKKIEIAANKAYEPEPGLLLARVDKGIMTLGRGSEVFFLFEPGDGILFSGMDRSQGMELTSKDLSVEISICHQSSVFRLLREDAHFEALWNEWVGLQLKMRLEFLLPHLKHEEAFSPDIQMYSPGQVIIAEGDFSTDVFTLVEGRAEVRVRDVKIGEVAPDEIFGALAALMNQPRTATVIAVESCTALRTPKEEFLALIQKRPATILKMIETMARTILNLNDTVVQQKSRGR